MSDRPNIVFLFSDQQRWDTVGACGSPLGITPNLDRLAAEGVAYDHCFTPQPVCGPARASLQTGLWPTQHGVWRNDIALALDAVTMPRLLGAAGYDLAYIGKWHLATDDGLDPARPRAVYSTEPVPLERRGGWHDYWLAADVLEFTSHGYGGHMFDAKGNAVEWAHYRVDALTDYAVEYLASSRDAESPFCLFVSYLEPHHQNDRNCYEGPEGSAERFADAWVPDDLRLSEVPGDWREQWPDYLGCVASLDTNVGRVLDVLAELEIEDNTLVIYTSDHGCHFMTRNWEYKRSWHDASTRVPLVLRGPGFTNGEVRSDLVSLLDVSATVVAASGQDVPGDWSGQPLGWSNTPRPYAYSQISESICGRVVRTPRWTYGVRDPDESTGFLQACGNSYVEGCLYDNVEDPHQLTNRVADKALTHVRDELRQVLLEAMAKSGEEPPTITLVP